MAHFRIGAYLHPMTKTQRRGIWPFRRAEVAPAPRHEAAPPALVSTKQAAAILGVTPSTVARRVQNGTLTPHWKNEGRAGGYVFVAKYILSVAARENGTIPPELDEENGEAS